jgi:hypothetical protein
VTAGLLTVTAGLLAVTVEIATLAASLAASLERAIPGAAVPSAGAEGLPFRPAGLPEPSPVAVFAAAVAATWPVAIGGAHLLARALARR